MDRQRYAPCTARRTGTIALLALGAAVLGSACSSQRAHYVSHQPPQTSGPRVFSDFGYYYSPKGLVTLAEGLAVGAGMANSNADTQLQDWYQTDFRSDATDGFASGVKPLGEGRYAFPALAGALLVGTATARIADESPLGDYGSVVGEWGDRSLRAALVGTAPMLIMQEITGASRPDEDAFGSKWQPLSDTNGVSGHAYVGALPLITAAQMAENPYAKASLYFASTWTAWSRVNDDDHFTSQAILGWWMAYVAASAVNDTEWNQRDVRFTAVPVPGGVGLGIVLER